MITLNEEKNIITMTGIHTITVFGLHAMCQDIINRSEKNPPPAELIGSCVAFDLAASEFMATTKDLDKEFTTQDVKYVTFLLHQKKELIEVHKSYKLEE